MIDPAPFDTFGIVVVLLLVVGIPLAGRVEFDLLDRWIRAGRRDARIRFYRWIMFFEWTLTLLLLGWWFARGGDAESIGLVPRVQQWQWLGVAAGLGLSYVFIMQMNMALASDDQLRKMAGELGKLRFMAPRDHREQGYFLQVSITAGICEEILYRGLLMNVLARAVGHWPALVLVAVIFGLGHLYQGRDGLLKTGAVGLAFGFLAWASGSLYVVMILHAVLDLASGRIMQGAVNLAPARPWSGDSDPSEAQDDPSDRDS